MNMCRVLIMGTFVPVLGAPARAADDPVALPPEAIRQHIEQQVFELLKRDQLIDELVNQVRIRDKMIDNLRSKTNCA